MEMAIPTSQVVSVTEWQKSSGQGHKSGVCQCSLASQSGAAQMHIL